MSQSPTGSWHNRIVGYDPEVDPSSLLHNPANWRIHPASQRAALNAALDDHGWIDCVKVNTVTGHIVDGHARVEEADRRGERVPVLYVELPADKEQTALVMHDAITALAVTDEAKLSENLTDIQQHNPAMRALIDQALDFGSQVGAGHGLTEASTAALIRVTIGDPQHCVDAGDVWRLGPHQLVCADVLTGWEMWQPYLVAGLTFAPYAGPYVTRTIRAARERLLIVQPSPYLAARACDVAAEHLGADAVTRLVAGAAGPSDDEVHPDYVGPTTTGTRVKRKAS